ncbi:hypothetical protein [Streptomyces sp. NPDC048603]|uniref:hypothetical protein n=1 Tax=Streptomyces sp. NPDC048603 TaxID=3365577 RepID=UPI003723F50D
MRGRGGRALTRRRSGRAAMAAGLALCATLALAGCQGDDGGTGAGGPASGAVSPSAQAPEPAAPSGAPAPSAPKATPTATLSKPVQAPKATATPAGKPKSPAPGASCDHKMPISPDEIAVHRYTPEGGFHSLIVRHGNWGCGTPDSDGAPFEEVGVETFLPIADGAAITAVTPIVESTENQKITLQQLIDWLVAHPNQGLVFRYHLGAKGAIDKLDQVFTP